MTDVKDGSCLNSGSATSGTFSDIPLAASASASASAVCTPRSSTRMPVSSSSVGNGLIKIEAQHLPRSEERIRCCFCFAEFSKTNDEYRLHLLTHLEGYRGKSLCPICRVGCPSYERMVDHVFMVHGGLEMLVCSHPSCVRSFRTLKTLDEHEHEHNHPFPEKSWPTILL